MAQDTQNNTLLNVSTQFDNFAAYTSQLYNDDCYNDPGASFQLYNSETGALVSSQSGYSHCGSLGNGNNWLGFPPVQLASGTYFIHYRGGDGEDWITSDYTYTAPLPHNQPNTTSSLSPNPTTPGSGLVVYSDPVTVTLQATADTGYNVANTYYKVDGGTQQTYISPFAVSGSGTHSIEYWSVDNTGLQETQHKSQSFTINPQEGTINSISQNSTTIDLSVHFANFDAYMAQLYNDDCYNDPGASFQLYDATTGSVVSSQSGYSHCGKLGNGNNWLGFPPLQLASGTYFIHYHGGDNEEWVTSNFTYTAPAPVHNKPLTTSALSPAPSNPANDLAIYSDPTTVTISATADSGYTVTNTYYKVYGGTQQTYSNPFTVSGSGSHSIEYWSVDNTGLEENPHKGQSFIINPQHGIINYIEQDSVSIDVSTHFSNFDTYMAQLYNDDCYNDPGASFQLYNATTGALVSSQSNYAHCGKLDPGNNWLGFPPLQINSGTYFIHYHGGDGEEWITDNFTYTGNKPYIYAIPNATVDAGSEYSYVGSFIDPNATGLTATVDYGDASGTQPLTLNGQNFTLTHTYASGGTHTVAVVISDGNAATGSRTTTITVNTVATPTPTYTPTPTPTVTSTPTPTATPTPSTTTLIPTADSYIKQGSQNENEGASTFLRLQSSGHNRAVVKFDESQIQQAVGNSQSYTATLQFTISDNGNNWGTSGRTIELHMLLQNWAEGNGFIDGNSPANRGTGSGVTWNCATDSNIANQNNDCTGTTAWNMDNSSLWPFASAVTASTNIINNQTGTINLNVTSDVQSFLNGTNQNYGWLIKKTDEGTNGKIQFGSKESSNSPKLIITPN